MADFVDVHPTAATLSRCQIVRGLIHRIFAITYKHLSQLEGRTIKKYCFECLEKKCSYVHKYFTEKDKNIVEGYTPVEEYDAHLLHKLLKTCCGLEPPNKEVWKSKDVTPTIEFLITYCWTEYNNMCEGNEMTDSDLNHHMDKVLDALVLIIEKVEECKEVDESALKSELAKHVGEKFDMYNDFPASYHIYSILSQHSVHMMLVIVYQQLNILRGQSLSDFLKDRRINLTPRTFYSNEHKFLEQNPLPQNMSISILYKVVKRVCFGFNPYRKSETSNALEATIYKLKQEYSNQPASEDEYMQKSYIIYKILKTALMQVSQQEGKSIYKIIQSLPKEPFIVESFRKPFEVSTCSTQPASVFQVPTPHSSKESSGVPSNSVPSLHTPSLAMAAASSPDKLVQEEINVAVLFKVLRRGGLVVQTLALVFEALKGSVQNLIGTGKTKKGKDILTNDEKKALANYQHSNNTDDLAQVDVTLVCKLLRLGCPSLSPNDNVWTTQANTLEYTITTIRKERNKLSHDVTTIPTAALNKTLQTIMTYLDTMLEMTGNKLGKNEENMRQVLMEQRKKIKNDIPKIATSTPHSSYLFTMENLKEDMISKIKVEGREELQQMHLYRENLLYMSPLSASDDRPLKTKDVYVDRELEDMSDTKAVGCYKIKEVLFCQDNELTSSKIIVIHGRSGEGKTSVCKHAYHIWSENLVESSENGVDLFIYIPCRYIDTESISAYLKRRLPKTFKSIDKDDIIPLIDELGVVFVIDGYDEAGKEGKGLIADILTSLPDSRVIITTKTPWLPEVIKKVKSVTSCFRILSMVGVTDDVRQQLIRKIFRVMRIKDENCDRFLNYLNQVKAKISELICRPLTFCLLSMLWVRQPAKVKKIQTSTQLYYRIYDLIFDRVCKKLNIEKSDCYEWMITLGEIAWKNMKINRYHLSKQDLITLKTKAKSFKLSEDNNYILSSLLQCDKIDSSMDDEAKHWNFTVSSQQEYFAAEYIVDSLIRRKSSLSEILELPEKTDENYKKKLQRLLPLIEFVIGLLEIYEELTNSRVKEITDIMSVTEPWAFKAIVQMLNPLLQILEVEDVVKTLFMNQVMSTFEYYDPDCILWMLKNTSLRVPKDVTIINTVNEFPQMKPLLNFLLNTSSVKVVVDVNKVSNISGLAELTRDMSHKNIVFAFQSWKPVCITKLLQAWPWSSPLRLSLCPEVFHLVCWELLICLMSLNCKVTKIVYSPVDAGYGEVVKVGANWLMAEAVTDSTLASTELLVQCAPNLHGVQDELTY